MVHYYPLVGMKFRNKDLSFLPTLKYHIFIILYYIIFKDVLDNIHKFFNFQLNNNILRLYKRDAQCQILLKLDLKET